LSNGGEEHARSLGIDPGRLRDQTAAVAVEASARARRLVDAFLDQVAPSGLPR
jgi:hypothetical protein